MGGAGAPDLMETCRVPQRCVYLPHPFVPCMLETLPPYKGFSSLLPLLLGSSAPVSGPGGPRGYQPQPLLLEPQWELSGKNGELITCMGQLIQYIPKVLMGK